MCSENQFGHHLLQFPPSVSRVHREAMSLALLAELPSTTYKVSGEPPVAQRSQVPFSMWTWVLAGSSQAWKSPSWAQKVRGLVLALPVVRAQRVHDGTAGWGAQGLPAKG